MLPVARRTAAFQSIWSLTATAIKWDMFRVKEQDVFIYNKTDDSWSSAESRP